MVLAVGKKNKEKYGYYYGRKKFKKELRIAFENIDSALSFTADDYSIDIDDEVKLVVNDVVLGYLAVSKNAKSERLVKSKIKIPEEILVPGYNLLVLKQKKPGWKWGVTNIGLNPVN